MAPRRQEKAQGFSAALLAAVALVLLFRRYAPESSLNFTSLLPLSNSGALLERRMSLGGGATTVPVSQPTTSSSFSSSSSASAAGAAYSAAAAAVGAALVVAYASCSRDDALVQMFSRHDRRTFRGKQHNHTFGKFRLRKNKARRLRDIKNGTYDPDNIEQRGQPEPRHTWDGDIMLDNPMVNMPQFAKDVIQDCIDNAIENQRENWKRQMGKYGKQMAFENWTPPEEK